jgi:hypothetical protein
MKTLEIENDIYTIFEDIHTNSIGECERKFNEFKLKYGDSACAMVTGANGYVPQ